MLVMLVMTISLFMLLGVSLLALGQVNVRVSRHLAEADQAWYAAEAGVEWALSVLPRDGSELLGFETSFGHEDVPSFAVVLVPSLERAYSWRVTSEGKAGRKEKRAEALVCLLPFGGRALVGSEVVLSGVTVRGGAVALNVVFGPGESVITGELASGSLAVDGGIFSAGKELVLVGHELPVVDFAGLWVRAEEEFWPVLGEGESLYRLAGDAGINAGPLVVDENLELAGGFLFDGVILVGGSVSVVGVPEGQVVLLVEEDITFLDGVQLDDGSSLVAWCGGVCSYAGGEMLFLRGVLFAEALSLADVEIVYCDLPAVYYLADLPAELVNYSPGFAVEWLEVGRRR